MYKGYSFWSIPLRLLLEWREHHWNLQLWSLKVPANLWRWTCISKTMIYRLCFGNPLYSLLSPSNKCSFTDHNVPVSAKWYRMLPFLLYWTYEGCLTWLITNGFVLPQGVFKPVFNMTEWGYKTRKQKFPNSRNYKLTQLISVYRKQITLICCAGISKVHQKADHLQPGSSDVKTEFIWNPSLLKQVGKSISCSWGKAVSVRAIYREKGFRRRLEWTQGQSIVSPQQSAKLLLNERWSHGCTGQISIISLCSRTEERETRNPALILCRESHQLLRVHCNYCFKLWKHTFVFARTILVSGCRLRRAFLTSTEGSRYESQDIFLDMTLFWDFSNQFKAQD